LTLRLNLEDTSKEEDTVAPYSRQQTPLSQESIVLGITTALRAHHINFIIIRATDPLDMVFLTRYLRQTYPQGRLVTLGADLLFRREVRTIYCTESWRSPLILYCRDKTSKQQQRQIHRPALTLTACFRAVLPRALTTRCSVF